jgi:hypothetical protein
MDPDLLRRKREGAVIGAAAATFPAWFIATVSFSGNDLMAALVFAGIIGAGVVIGLLVAEIGSDKQRYRRMLQIVGAIFVFVTVVEIGKTIYHYVAR